MCLAPNRSRQRASLSALGAPLPVWMGDRSGITALGSSRANLDPYDVFSTPAEVHHEVTKDQTPHHLAFETGERMTAA